MAKQAARFARAQPIVGPALAVFFATVAGIASPVYGSIGFAFALFFLTWNRARLLYACWLCGLFLITLAHLALTAPRNGAFAFDSETFYQGQVTQWPLRTEPALCALAVDAPGDRLQNWAISLPRPLACPEPGTRLTVRGRLETVNRTSNPGGFDEATWLRTQQISRKVAVDSLRVLQAPGWRWRISIALRHEVQQILTTFIPEGQRGIVLSTVLGDMKALSYRTKADFQNTGMLHILAISGQHIALMVAIALQTFQFIRIPQRAICILIVIGLFFYGPATGNTPSVVRSIAMFAWLLPPILLRRPTSAFTTMGLATVFSLWDNPEIISHVGWQLSYLATLILLLFARRCEALAESVVTCLMPRSRTEPASAWDLRLRKVAVVALACLLVSGTVTLGTLPIIAASTHLLMPLAPLANLITVPLGTGLLTCAFLTCATAPLPWIPDLLGMSAGFFAFALERVVHGLAQWQSGMLAFSSWPSGLSFVFFLLLLGWPYLPASLRPRVALGVVSMAAMAWFIMTAQAWWQPQVRVTMLDVGQGQAVLVEMAGDIVLVDAGPAKPDAGVRSILPALRALGHNHLDAVLLSHGDADHIGGLASLLPELPISKVALGGTWPEDGLWPNLAKALQAKAIEHGRLLAGRSLLRHGAWHLRSVDLGAVDSSSRNDASTVIVLEGPAGRVVIPGDIGSAPMSNLADTVELWRRSDASQGISRRDLHLIIPHHGSDRTSDTAALRRMEPDLALISAGRRNRFGHPGPATLAVLKNVGSRIFMTPKDGAVTLSLRGDTMRCEAYFGLRDVD